MLMEGSMTSPDARSLYVLLGALVATLLSAPAVWFFANGVWSMVD